jgi:hypothetical protein
LAILVCCANLCAATIVLAAHASAPRLVRHSEDLERHMMLKKFAAALLATSMIAAVATVAYGMGGGGGGGGGGSGAGAAGAAGGAGGAGTPPGGSPSVTDGAPCRANRPRRLPARSTARDRHSRWRRARSDPGARRRGRALSMPHAFRK